jgi:hypothetical protein
MLWPCGSRNGPVNVPSGYLLCDGSIVSQATYAALYAVIGNTYGLAPGSGNFYLPNTIGRAPMGSVGNSYTVTLTVSNSINVDGPTINPGDTNNGWVVTATTNAVYIGMEFNFGGTLGFHYVNQILGTNASGGLTTTGNGYLTPFILVFDSNPSGAATAYTPIVTPASYTLTYSPIIGTTQAPLVGLNPGQITTLPQNMPLMGGPYITQSPDQVGTHSHGNGFGAGGINAANASNNPIQGQNTTQNTGTYNANGTVVPGQMSLLPMNFGVFYFIKT